MKKISILVPCYNEEKNVAPMAEALTKVMSAYADKYEYEIIFRDNASLDNTLNILRLLAQRDKRIKVIAINTKHNLLLMTSHSANRL